MSSQVNVERDSALQRPLPLAAAFRCRAPGDDDFGVGVRVDFALFDETRLAGRSQRLPPLSVRVLQQYQRVAAWMRKTVFATNNAVSVAASDASHAIGTHVASGQDPDGEQ
jgi:hypothetical protein